MSAQPSHLRAVAEACLREALAAVAPGRLVHAALQRRQPELRAARRVALVAAGKAAPAMAAAAVAELGERPVTGVIVAPTGAATPGHPGLRVMHSGHPLPDAGSVAAGEAVAALAAGLGADDLLLVLLSGGASAMLALPPAGVALEELAATVGTLLRGGVDIAALNLVRRHLDRLKGGRLAALAHPAAVLGLVLSDVVGDRLEVVASGPLSGDPSTAAQALAVLAPFAVPATVRRHLEHAATPPPAPGDPRLAGVELELLAGNREAVAATARAAATRGWPVEVLAEPVEGEAREAGRRLARHALTRGPGAVVAGGETTVTVTGGGAGGRNQELVVAAAEVIAGRPEVVVASLATDGVDGASRAAGGIVDGTTAARAAALGRPLAAVLADNDSGGLLAALGDAIVTGPTGTNVADVQLVLVGSPGPAR